MAKKKTTSDLKREIAALKKKQLVEAMKKKKLMHELKEKKELERELRSLKSSGALKQLRTISKRKPTKAQLRSSGKRVANAAKTTYNVAGKIVNRLSKIDV